MLRALRTTNPKAKDRQSVRQGISTSLVATLVALGQLVAAARDSYAQEPPTSGAVVAATRQHAFIIPFRVEPPRDARETPVEVVVSLEGWAKVRDAEGGLAWIEKKHLADNRTLIVTAESAQVRQRAEEGSPIVFDAERKVALDYLEMAPAGWIKVRHRDGASGFVRASQVWGY